MPVVWIKLQWEEKLKMKSFRKSDFKAAVRDPQSGRVFTGLDHSEALRKAEEAGVEYPGGQMIPAHTGFLRKDGTFFTRAETGKEYGFTTSADLR